jgi:hypothetical protein
LCGLFDFCYLVAVDGDDADGAGDLADRGSGGEQFIFRQRPVDHVVNGAHAVVTVFVRGGADSPSHNFRHSFRLPGCRIAGSSVHGLCVRCGVGLPCHDSAVADILQSMLYCLPEIRRHDAQMFGSVDYPLGFGILDALALASGWILDPLRAFQMYSE